jgi:hypothetical protein
MVVVKSSVVSIRMEDSVDLSNTADSLVRVTWAALKEVWEWAVKVTMAVITVAWAAAWAAEWVEALLEEWVVVAHKVVAAALVAGRRCRCSSLNAPCQTLVAVPVISVHVRNESTRQCLGLLKTNDE